VRRRAFQSASLFGLFALFVSRGPADSSVRSHSLVPSSARVEPQQQGIDGVAARIEDDIITESELRELAAFQVLVDGKSKPRLELIRELADQWIITSEAKAARYAPPPPQDIDLAVANFQKQFHSPEEYRDRCAQAGISAAAVRRLIAEQLYLTRFMDYRFRAAAQVSDETVEAYYRDEFAPQLRAQNQPVPPLDDVDDTIREVLIQRTISERAQKWLDETRDRLKLDIVTQNPAVQPSQPSAAPGGPQ
jgi:hypothetical protein